MKEKQRESLALFSRRCKTCKHLDPEESKAWVSCHFTKGNEHCPAQEIQFIIVGEAYRLAKQILLARDVRNAAEEAKILAKVARESQTFQERFYAALENSTEK
jgi:hypothetical protein